MKYELLLAASAELWAILPSALQAMLMADAAGPGRPKKLPSVKGSVAILPIHGEISQRGSIWQELFGGTSTQRLAAQYSRAVNDDRVGAVVFDVDSPGGTVSGVPEAADVIREGARLKPTYAVASGQMASAAYWLASQVGAGNLMASKSSNVGSIGVVAVHEDYSEYLKNKGIKVSALGVPEYKTEGWTHSPLSDEARDQYMARINDTYNDFVGDIAAARGMKAETIKADYGRGRTFHGAEAKQRGMIDRVATISQVVSELTRFSKGEDTEAIAAGIIEAGDRGLVEAFHRGTSMSVRARRLVMLDKSWSA